MKNPLIPMGAVTGDLTTEQIRTMLRRYADKGITQFLMYPRDGCDVPYMSERWLEICGGIIRTADEYGMDIWLYDEFNWPSGTCRGAVMAENEEYFAHRAVVEDGKVVVRRTDRYADILNPDAVDCFIRLTHQVYFDRFGEYFGRVIKGIFTDEPAFSYYAAPNEYPWCKDLDKLYLAATGRDLFADMTAPTDEFRGSFYRVLANRFRESFADKIAGWCTDHGILLTGHLLAESVLSSSIRASGDTIRVLRGFNLPGMDEISTRTTVNTAEWLTFGAAQAAIRTGNNGGLVETFALGPTDLPPARVEQMLWLEAMFNLDHYVLAVAAADARGNVKKNGWYNPMNYTSPWFEGYPELGASASLAASYAQKTIRADMAVRVPYRRASETLANCVVSDRLTRLLRELVRAQVQWILLDEDEEAPAGLPVLTIDESEGWDEKAVAASLPARPVEVLDENGEKPDDLFLRLFTDGSAVVLDLRDSNETRPLKLMRDGSVTAIDLPGRGHYIAGSPAPKRPETLAELSPDFNLTLERPNVLRANIRSDKTDFTFTVSERLGGLRLLVRDYLFDGEVSLDGVVLTERFPTDALLPGLAELYHATAPFALLPGTHTVRVSQPAASEPFLPSVFLVGAFASDETDTLRALPKTVPTGRLDQIVLPEYAGKLTLETTLTLPDTPSKLALDSSELYTRVYVNGVSLGGQLSGFVWTLPEALAGQTVLLRIEQYTSIGPLFGRAADVIAEGDGEKWAKLDRWFPKIYQKCGVERFRFVK